MDKATYQSITTKEGLLCPGTANNNVHGSVGKSREQNIGRVMPDYRVSIRGHIPPDLHERIAVIHAAALLQSLDPRSTDNNAAHSSPKKRPDGPKIGETIAPDKG